MPISSTCCEHWLALMTGSRHSLVKLKNHDGERLSPCPNLRYTNVLNAKLNAGSSTECCSAI